MQQIKGVLAVVSCAVGAAVLSVAIGCSVIGDMVISPTQSTVVDNSTGGGAGSTASPSPSGLPPGAYVRVGVFGYSCSDGYTNSDATVRVGCTASITATPKDSSGNDLSEAIHGPDITWTITGGAAECVASAATSFNRECRGLAVGQQTLVATVKGVSGSLVLSVVR